MNRVSGGCHCGNMLVDLGLTRAPDTYNPRACDCDFCRKHCASYLSDPHGWVIIRIKDERHSGKYQQGSGIAEFLLCRNCGVLVAVLYRGDGRVHGAVNTKAIDGATSFGTEQPVSPKTLPSSEKVKRWQSVWFSDVRIVTGEA